MILMLKIPSEIISKPIYYIKHRLAVVKFLQIQDSEQKSNFIFSDFGILLVCLQYRSKMDKMQKKKKNVLQFVLGPPTI